MENECTKSALVLIITVIITVIIILEQLLKLVQISFCEDVFWIQMKASVLSKF